jgi:hypothetical protein
MNETDTKRASHTPGPWEDAGSGLVTANGGQHGIGRAFHTQRNNVDRSRANARLFAAAPDLLEACEACEKAMAKHDNDWPGNGYQPRKFEGELIVARTVIMKAKGEI